MALFSSKKNTKETKAAAPVKKAAPAEKKAIQTKADIAHILHAPRITEKAAWAQEKGVYVFDIPERATKRDITSAVKKIYGVTPQSVRVVPVPSKTVRHMRTGKYGVKKGGKKAYVYLKKGETITLA